VELGLVPVALLSVFNFLIYVSIARANTHHNIISSAHRSEILPVSGFQNSSPAPKIVNVSTT
jgi:hypothetical protein